MRNLYKSAAVFLLAAGCASGGARQPRTQTNSPTAAPPPPAAAAANQDTTVGPQYPSTYQRHPNPPVLIKNATILTAAGQEIQGGSILFRDGRSEEHTSELQSQSKLVCRLLLAKKT